MQNQRGVKKYVVDVEDRVISDFDVNLRFYNYCYSKTKKR